MKYITFTVPCYNSQDYMRNCINRLVAAGEDIEVIIVNDGSTDNTLKIAKEYQDKYPNIVRVIDKENGGHGSGVMAGIRNAKGIYFKVVDSDDWVETDDVLTLVNLIKTHLNEGKDIDLYITNYVYEHVSDGKFFEMNYRKCLPIDQVFTWSEMKHVKLETVFLMHSLMYKLDTLKASGMELPNHTFYVDDIYAYVPLPYVKNIFYHDLDLYHYYIGREGQSINYETMCERYEQQMRVFDIMFNAYSYETLNSFVKPLAKYMAQFLMIIAAITIMTIIGTTKDKQTRRKVFKKYWKDKRLKDKKLTSRVTTRSATVLAFIVPFYNLRAFASRKIYASYQRRLKLG